MTSAFTLSERFESTMLADPLRRPLLPADPPSLRMIRARPSCYIPRDRRIQLECEQRMMRQVFATGHPLLYTLDDYLQGEEGASEWMKRQALFTFKFAGAP